MKAFVAIVKSNGFGAAVYFIAALISLHFFLEPICFSPLRLSKNIGLPYVHIFLAGPAFVYFVIRFGVSARRLYISIRDVENIYD